MKKIVVLAFLSAIAFTSCKKKYTCNCTYPENSVYRNTAAESGKLSKADAERWCENAGNGAKLLGGNCTLQ